MEEKEKQRENKKRRCQRITTINEVKGQDSNIPLAETRCRPDGKTKECARKKVSKKVRDVVEAGYSRELQTSIATTTLVAER
jgi:hypothetical protein